MVSNRLTAAGEGQRANSDSRLVPEDSVRAVRLGRHRLDEMEPGKIAKHLVGFEPNEQVITDILAIARLSIPGIAQTEEVLKVVRYNPFCVMALARRSKFDPEAPEAEGFVAALPLNDSGMRLLALGSFNATSPDLRLVAKPGERPAGIYMWGVYAPGPLAAGMALFMDRISGPLYEGINLYSRPNTEAGRRYNEVLGAIRGVTIDGIEAPNVWMFSRTPKSPLYDTYVPKSGAKEIGITVARTFDDLMRVAAIRNAVYIGEQECPYDEEYDGNDFSATHLIAYMGDEPAGCMRLRFFAGFAKFERVAVRKEYRKSRVAIRLVQAGLQLCQKKGYERVIGHAQTRLSHFWTRFGFRAMEGRKHFVFSDYDYVEMVAELTQNAGAITIESDPYVVIRPEGRWHVPGVLEQSASRAATNPSVAKKR